jgi:hypothetical protein
MTGADFRCFAKNHTPSPHPGRASTTGLFYVRREKAKQRLNPCRVIPKTGRSNMASTPVSTKDGEQGTEDKQANAHKPAKHIEETARLASSVEPNKDPEKVRIAGERSEQP